MAGAVDPASEQFTTSVSRDATAAATAAL